MTDLFEANIVRKATISRGGQNRLTLTRHWGAGERRVCFVGLNPSTADHQKDDPTVRRWIHFAKEWGFDGFVAVNLYPYRSSSIAECRRWSEFENNGPDWYARDDICQNFDVIGRIAKICDLVIACWGASTWDDVVVENAIEAIQCFDEPWPDIYCLGFTLRGDPIHPMARGKHRVPDNAKPLLWRSAR